MDRLLSAKNEDIQRPFYLGMPLWIRGVFFREGENENALQIKPIVLTMREFFFQQLGNLKKKIISYDQSFDLFRSENQKYQSNFDLLKNAHSYIENKQIKTLENFVILLQIY